MAIKCQGVNAKKSLPRKSFLKGERYILNCVSLFTLYGAYFGDQISEEDKELDKAEQMSLRTIKAEPNNATYLDTYAWILYKQQRYEEAYTYIEQALAADSVPSDVLYEHAGDICYRMGDTARAVDYWKQALEVQRKAEAVEQRLEKKVRTKKM